MIITTEPLCLEQDDARYPTAFFIAPHPPERVWVLGDLSLLEKPAVGIVGTRKPSAYGLGVAIDAARELASSGLVIVSGMAPGLDARAHQGALDAGGGTIGVLGCGIDVDYPRPNLKLLRDVRRRGLVITEFAPGTDPYKGNFPKRNRLIAALSQVLLVVEAAIRSGTANTVRWMSESLGRPVFAVPGRVGDPMSAGPNNLLRDGAHPYVHANDIRMHFKLPLEPEEGRDVPEERREQPSLFGVEAELYDIMGRKPVHVDHLVERTAIQPGLLLAALSSLELQGLVQQLPGKRFALAS